jgi:hypothetical protein
LGATKNIFRKKLKAQQFRGILATIHFRVRLLSKTTKIKIHKIINLLAFYGCRTWSPPVRGDHRLSVFENRVMRILG